MRGNDALCCDRDLVERHIAIVDPRLLIDRPAAIGRFIAGADMPAIGPHHREAAFKCRWRQAAEQRSIGRPVDAIHVAAALEQETAIPSRRHAQFEPDRIGSAVDAPAIAKGGADQAMRRHFPSLILTVECRRRTGSNLSRLQHMQVAVGHLLQPVTRGRRGRWGRLGRCRAGPGKKQRQRRCHRPAGPKADGRPGACWRSQPGARRSLLKKRRHPNPQGWQAGRLQRFMEPPGHGHGCKSSSFC